MGKNARKGSEGDGEGRKTKKPKWTAKAQGQGQAMPSGSKGVLITVDPGKEKRAGYEAINLLNEFHDKLCGGGSADRPAGEPAGPESSQGVPDIQAEIAREVEGIQDRSCQRFRFHDTGMRGLIYIIQQSPRSSSAPDESQAAGAADGNGKGQEAGGGAEEVDPVDLVVTLLKDAQATKQCRTRHCIRWIPVCQVFRPSLEAMKEAAAGFVAPRFTTDAALGASAAGHDNGNDGQNAASARQPTRSSSGEQQQDGTDSAGDGGPAAASGAEGAHKPSSTAGGGLGGGWRVSVNVERRALPGVDRKEVIDTFINQVPCPPHKVDLDHPQRTISVQIIRNACGLAVLPDYFELLKYNIRSLAGVDPDTGLAKE